MDVPGALAAERNRAQCLLGKDSLDLQLQLSEERAYPKPQIKYTTQSCCWAWTFKDFLKENVGKAVRENYNLPLNSSILSPGAAR